MADVFNSSKRSEIMSRIRSKNTEVERIVFKYLREKNLYFQRHYTNKKLKINIDIARPREKKAVFLDGDFWHGRNYKKAIERLPDDGYWKEKIKRNVERDAKNDETLKEAGWQVLHIWETDIKRKSTREEELEKIKNFLAK